MTMMKRMGPPFTFAALITMSALVSTPEATAQSNGGMTFRQARTAIEQSLTAGSLCPDESYHDIRVTYDGIHFTGPVEASQGMSAGSFTHADPSTKTTDNLALNIAFSDYKGFFLWQSYRGNLFNPADFDVHSCGEQDFYRVTLELKSRKPARYISIRWRTEHEGRQFVDALNWLTTNAATAQIEMQEAQKRFEKAAMPDAAHEHEVLAKNAVEEKNFNKAIDEYKAGLEIFSTWPDGQFNLAMICGETGDYYCAVEHMQDYLTLVPSASDSQAAKDRLIVWKDKLKSEGD
jgi:hypothetical protein